MQEIKRERRQGNIEFDMWPAAIVLGAGGRDRKTDEGAQEKEKEASYFRALARPRSEKYRQLIGRQMQIANRLNDLFKQQQGVGVTKSDAGAEDGDGAEPSIVTADGTEQKRKETQENTEQQKSNPVAEEIARLQAELAQVQKETELEMPIGHGCLGLLYRSDNEKRLMDMEVIFCAGKHYENPEELLEGLPVLSEQIAQQWLKGDSLLTQNWEQCLVVEVYPTVICVVYEDGSVKNYRTEE